MKMTLIELGWTVLLAVAVLLLYAVGARSWGGSAAPFVHEVAMTERIQEGTNPRWWFYPVALVVVIICLPLLVGQLIGG